MCQKVSRIPFIHAVMVSVISLVYLLLFAAEIAQSQEQENSGQVMIVYDLSGSMALPLGKGIKSDLTKQALLAGLKDLEKKAQVGLIAFGHRSKSSCSDLQVAAALAPATNSVETIKAFLDRAEPKGRAPVAAALRLAGSKLAPGKPNQSLVLVVDGLDSCEEDPCGVVDHLFDQGVGFKAHVIGIGVEESQFKALSCVAAKLR